MADADNWLIYPSKIEDQHAIVWVNLTLAASAPDASKPHALMVRIVLNEHGEQGFGTDDERNQVMAAADEIEAKLRDDCTAAFAGSVRTSGRVDLWYYMPADQDDTADAIVENAFPDHEVRWGIENDAAWKIYHEQLLPSPLELLHGLDMQMVQQLAEAGENLSVQREVQHAVRFAQDRRLDSFIVAAAASGYELKLRRTASADEPARVELTRLQTTDMSEVMTRTEELYALAEAYGGEYDGWGISQSDDQ